MHMRRTCTKPELDPRSQCSRPTDLFCPTDLAAKGHVVFLSSTPTTGFCWSLALGLPPRFLVQGSGVDSSGREIPPEQSKPGWEQNVSFTDLQISKPVGGLAGSKVPNALVALLPRGPFLLPEASFQDALRCSQ